MAKDVKIPEISEGIEEAEVSQVLVSKGDHVEEDQPLLELESDKATVELPSPYAGTVQDISVAEGDTVKVGQTVMQIEAGGSGAAEEPEEPDEDEEEETAEGPEEPKESEAEDEEAAEAEETEQEAAAEAEQDEEEEAPEEESKKQAPTAAGGRPPAAAPSVRKLARHLGVDLQNVQGSGPGRRITEQDVKDVSSGKKSALKKKPAQKTEEAEEQKAERTEEATQKAEGQRIQPSAGSTEKMSKIRRVTAETMARSWQTIPHVTQFDKTDISWFDVFRRRYGDRVEAAGGKLTITAVIIKILARALDEFPRFNTTLDIENEEIAYNETCHIGVAVDADPGLLVPVIRDCNTKTISEIAAELVDKAERARTGKLSPEEMKGGNFTVSNLGGVGGTAFTPIILPPQVGILGVARAGVEPVYEDGEFQPRKILPLSLSYDHRVIDGAEGARFLHWICEALSAPLLMELD